MQEFTTPSAQQSPHPQTGYHLQTQAKANRIRPIVRLLFVLCILGGGSYYLWQRFNTPREATQQQNSAIDTSQAAGGKTDKTFADPNNGVAVSVQDCTAGQQVALGATGSLLFSGKKSFADNQFCEMTLTATGKYGSVTLDCAYQVDEQPIIYVPVDDSGANQEFIRRYCVIRE